MRGIRKGVLSRASLTGPSTVAASVLRTKTDTPHTPLPADSQKSGIVLIQPALGYVSKE